jgi:phosphatidate phosphatase PAH1
MDTTAATRPLLRIRQAITALGFAVLLVAGAAACTVPTPPPSGGSPDVVVFDIDGTLTADELSTDAHPGAASAVNAYVAKGYTVVYVTARWNALESTTRDWLDDHGFPELPLYMPSSLLIDDQSKVDFKTETLQDIENGANEVIRAYGDSSSDFVAYANVGLPTSNVYALKRASASTCQSGAYTACMNDYVAHLPFIHALPNAS